jgi:hypothetical protein
MKKTNIVFAFADDWGRYASVYAKHQEAKSLNGLLDTPHFDRVAAEGALFLNAIVPAPSCTPVPQLDTRRSVLLANGVGCNFNGCSMGRVDTHLPLSFRG